MILNDEYFMKIALNEAIKASEIDEVPIGAVIVCHNKIIARAHNLCERLNDATAHAEMMAFTSASEFLGGKYLDDCTLYVTLEPCIMCAGAAAWTRINRIVFGAFDSKKGFSLFLNKNFFHPNTTISSGIMLTECSDIISRYFKYKR